MEAWSFDSETTGLRLYQTDRPFMFCWASPDAPLGETGPPTPFLPTEDRSITWFLMNAPFDMRALEMETGKEFAGDLHDVQVLARLENNRHMSYRLKDIAERLGYEKSEAVEDYIRKHRLYTMKKVAGKKKREKLKHFDRVPLEIVAPYGATDGSITRNVGIDLLARIEAMDAVRAPNHKPLMDVVRLESKVTKIVYAMIREGIGLDVDYCTKAASYYSGVIEDCESKWLAMTGRKFVDSFQALHEVFAPLGYQGGVTEKGQPSYTDKILSGIEHPLAEVVRTHRDATKRNSTFFLSFLEFVGQDGRIHPELRQGGTKTGRMSCAEPNLQQLSGDEDDGGGEDAAAFPVRRAFVPRPDYCFVSIDFKQQEYRLLADMAGETGLVAKINQGVDVHQATADLVGCTRKQAKTLNFGLLYGMGIKKLAAALNISFNEAKALRERYFEALPKIRWFIRHCTDVAEKRGWVKAWSGRVFRFPPVTFKNKDTGQMETSRFAYKATNAVIQGGSADITKTAMVNCVLDVLQGTRSKLLLPIHDELVFEVHREEMHLVPRLVQAMRDAYKPFNGCAMDCSVAVSDKNLHDLVDYQIGA